MTLLAPGEVCREVIVLSHSEDLVQVLTDPLRLDDPAVR